MIINRPPWAAAKFHGERRIVLPGVSESQSLVAVVSSFESEQCRTTGTRTAMLPELERIAALCSKTKSLPPWSRPGKESLLLEEQAIRPFGKAGCTLSSWEMTSCAFRRAVTQFTIKDIGFSDETKFWERWSNYIDIYIKEFWKNNRTLLYFLDCSVYSSSVLIWWINLRDMYIYIYLYPWNKYVD